MIRSVAIPVVVAFCLVGPEALAGQATPRCEDTPAFHVLDFWVGEWTVHAQDQQVGTNRIVKLLDGCAVEERWTGRSGGRGRSLFYVVPGLQEWRQGTVYEGWTADGSAVEIRDVFEPVEGGGFVSRTFLRPSPDDEWRRIAEDRWTRVEGSSREGGAPTDRSSGA